MKTIKKIFNCKNDSTEMKLEVELWNFAGVNGIMVEVDDDGAGISQNILISHKQAIQLANSILNQLKE